MNPFESLFVELEKTTVALFVVVDPIGTVPIVVGLTKDMEVTEKQRNFRIPALYRYRRWKIEQSGKLRYSTLRGS